MKILVCTKFDKEKTAAAVKNVVEKLISLDVEILADETKRDFFACDNIVYGAESRMLRECDMIITVGGDGTILKWGKKAAAAGKALLGINTGRLGFMATLECDELDKLPKLISGDYKISKRMLLDVNLEGNVYPALNDIVVSRNIRAKLPEFVVLKNNTMVTKVRADGLIFGTPTGSTAYSLSAGGPIIEPEIECLELTPLCAHTLFGRPMIFDVENGISVKFNGYENSEVSISIDGGAGIDFKENDVLTITKSDLSLNLIDIQGNNFYDAVNNKLMRPLK